MAKLKANKLKQIVLEDLRTTIDKLRESEASKGIWDKEVISIRNGIGFIKEM